MALHTKRTKRVICYFFRILTSFSQTARHLSISPLSSSNWPSDTDRHTDAHTHPRSRLDLNDPVAPCLSSRFTVLPQAKVSAIQYRSFLLLPSPSSTHWLQHCLHYRHTRAIARSSQTASIFFQAFGPPPSRRFIRSLERFKAHCFLGSTNGQCTDCQQLDCHLVNASLQYLLACFDCPSSQFLSSRTSSSFREAEAVASTHRLRHFISSVGSYQIARKTKQVLPQSLPGACFSRITIHT